MEWIKRLGIKHFRGIYSRDRLPNKIKKECGIINLDDIKVLEHIGFVIEI